MGYLVSVAKNAWHIGNVGSCGFALAAQRERGGTGVTHYRPPIEGGTTKASMQCQCCQMPKEGSQRSQSQNQSIRFFDLLLFAGDPKRTSQVAQTYQLGVPQMSSGRLGGADAVHQDRGLQQPGVPALHAALPGRQLGYGCWLLLVASGLGLVAQKLAPQEAARGLSLGCLRPPQWRTSVIFCSRDEFPLSKPGPQKRRAHPNRSRKVGLLVVSKGRAVF